MGTTTNRSYPYPGSADDPDVPADMQALAEAVDTDVAGLLPVGAVISYAGSSVPSGWLLCNGAAYDTGAYSDLFAVLGSPSVPNLIDRFVKGASTPGGTGGTKKIEEAHLPAHVHTNTHTHTMYHTHTGTTTSGGSHRHAIRDGSGPGDSNWSLANQPNALTSATAPCGYAGTHSHSFTTGGASNGRTSNPSVTATGSVGSGQDFEPQFLSLAYIIKAG